jgi:RRXRR protein
MSHVFVVDANRKPLNPVHPGQARVLLTQQKAAVFRRYPFTIILKTMPERTVVHPLRLKIDPGSRMSGLALVTDATGEVVFAAELRHRGQAIKRAMDQRRAVRRNRRQRKTRYRKARCANRTRRKGWLPPSLESRIANIVTWVQRLVRVAPISVMSQELVKFDLQRMDDPELSGMEYQQGTLAGHEVRENTCLRNGSGPVLIVVLKTSHCKWSIFSPKQREELIASTTCVWPVTLAIKPKEPRIFAFS